MAMDSEAESVNDILDRLEKLAGDERDVSVEDVKRAIGGRSYGAFLMVPALVELTPIGSIPGVPTFLATIIVIFAAQLLWGREHFWLPAWIGRRSVSSSKLQTSARKLRPVARRLDRWFHGRLQRFTTPTFIKLAAATCIGLCLTVPPLELIPFASSAPMGAIALLGLALLVRDGALMIAALAFSVAAVGVSAWLWLGQGGSSGGGNG